MPKIALSLSILGAMLALLSAAPAQAQATRTWVSSLGNDSNPCSRTSPCLTFAGAFSQTAAGGEINCIDAGGYGTVTVNKSISFVCDYTGGGVLASGTSGFVINAPAGSIITLKGLDIECAGTGVHGIRMLGVGVTLHIHKVQVRNCRGGGSGITIDPSSGTAFVNVIDSYITDNGNTPTTGAILVKPTGSTSVLLAVNRTQIENNSIGVRLDGTTTSGAIRATARDSLVAGSTFNGLTVVSAGATVRLMADNLGIFANGFGVVANGSGAIAQVGNSAITANTTGVFINSPPGQILTFGTNKLNANITDGAFTAPPISQQ